MVIGIQILNAEINSQAETHLIATIAGEVVGYVALKIAPPIWRPGAQEMEVVQTPPQSATFARLFVKQERRRQDIGTDLVMRCTTLARQAGCKTLGAVVEVGNIEVLPFYECLGFLVAYQFDDGDLIITKQL